MRLVVDASAGVALSLAAGGFDVVRHEMLAPVLFRSEVLSALRGLEWRREISEELGGLAANRLLEAPVRLVRRKAVWADARRVARRMGWAKTYDAEYIALAGLEEAHLLTLDDRLARRTRDLVRIVSPTDVSA